ncbi:MAG: hypothetical protein ACTTJV_03950 [Ottowia sp.]
MFLPFEEMSRLQLKLAINKMRACSLNLAVASALLIYFFNEGVNTLILSLAALFWVAVFYSFAGSVWRYRKIRGRPGLSGRIS